MTQAFRHLFVSQFRLLLTHNNNNTRKKLVDVRLLIRQTILYESGKAKGIF